MYIKIYEIIKKYIVDNYKFILFLTIIFLVMTYEFPYYVNTPGGLINLNDKIKIENSYNSEGTINLSYVLERKATLSTLLIAKFNKDWSVIKKEEVVAINENENDVVFRDKMLLEEANDYATIVAFSKLNKNVNINENHVYVTYVDEDVNSDLKIGDEILEVNNIKINSKEQLLNIIRGYSVNDILNIKVINNNKYSVKKAKLKEENGKVMIGILITEDLKFETNPNINFEFSFNESGPSGGLMETLYIYNALTKGDITKGLTIVGTGTIDKNGNVGSISGVEFKLKGAVKKDADIFFVPNGENYEEAIKIKQKMNYDIQVKGVDSFDEVIDYLNNLQL